MGLKTADVREALAAIGGLDRDAWAAGWMRIGERYLARAEREAASDPAAARADYLFAWRYFNFGRWPVPNAPQKAAAYAKARTTFLAYGRLAEPPIELIRIPFEGKEIAGYLQRPRGLPRPPVVISIGGVDFWKENMAAGGAALVEAGIANLSLDMPGTGEAPLGTAPGAERIYTAAIDYLLGRSEVDGTRIAVRGESWGSYWALRTGYANPTRLKGVVFQSGPVDRYFQRAWQEQSLKGSEYLFDFVPSRLYILGQPTLAAALDFMPTLSLVGEGLIDQPTPPMLLITGVKDSQTPYSDLLLLLENGSPKYAWINPQGGHMGRSKALKDEEIFQEVILPWLRQQLSSRP
jgi:esterase FrsA